MKRTSNYKKKKINQKKPRQQNPETKQNKNTDFLELFLSKKRTVLILSLLIIVIGILAFNKFLTINKLYYFKDIGSDIINQNYPANIASTNLSKESYFVKWSFYEGMGQNRFSGVRNEPIGVFRKFINKIYEFIWGDSYFIYSRFITTFIWHILFAGIIAFFYLHTLGIKNEVAFIGALYFAFLGYTILGSSWGYSGIVLNGIILLFAFEQMYIKGRWVFFPFAIIYISSNPYYFYWFILFYLTYITFRFYVEKENSKKILKIISQNLILGIIGLGINFINIFSTYKKMLMSPRVAGEASTIQSGGDTGVFAIDNFPEQLTSLFRLFSNDILGNGSNFGGWNNYLEAPIFYVGILSLILFPQIFRIAKKREKIAFAFFAGFWIITTLFPPIRNALHLYVGNYYKGVYDFVISYILLFTAIFALNEIVKQKKLNILTLVITVVVLLLILYIPWSDKLEYVLDKSLRSKISLLIITYGILLFFWNKQNFSNKMYLFLLLIVIIETTYSSGITVNRRETYGKRVFKSSTGGYNDATIDAVKFIKTQDNNFFRAEKDFSSGTSEHGSLNDAQAQNYFGTACYSSFNQYHYIRFLKDVGVINAKNETQTRWSPGVRGHTLLMSFASVKYFFTKNEKNLLLNQGFNIQKKFDDVFLLKNDYSLPLGFGYNKFIRKSEFDKLKNVFSKSAMLLAAYVVEDEKYELAQESGFRELHISDSLSAFSFSFAKLDSLVSVVREDTLQITSFKHSNIKGKIDASKNIMLFLSIPYDKGWKCLVDGKQSELHLTNIGFMGVYINKGNHEIELVFEPEYFTVGFIVLGVSYLLLIFLFIFRNKINLFSNKF
jgi:uncharacterized membrane protein YfhO